MARGTGNKAVMSRRSHLTRKHWDLREVSFLCVFFGANVVKLSWRVEPKFRQLSFMDQYVRIQSFEIGSYLWTHLLKNYTCSVYLKRDYKHVQCSCWDDYCQQTPSACKIKLIYVSALKSAVKWVPSTVTWHRSRPWCLRRTSQRIWRAK